MTTQNWPPIPFGEEKGKKRRKKMDAPGAKHAEPRPDPDDPAYAWMKRLPVIDLDRETLIIAGPLPRTPAPPKAEKRSTPGP